jgi:uncharacterized protein (TIGR00255 family)
MLKSMTGYGKAVTKFQNKTINIEVRSVNSKQLDISTRVPSLYKEKDLEFRTEIGRLAERGKIDLNINVEQTEVESAVQLNQTLVKEYFNQLKAIAIELNVPVSEQTLISAVRMPDTLKSETPKLLDEEVEAIMGALKEALLIFNQFREQEGKALAKDITNRVSLIEQNLLNLVQFEKGRVEKVKERLKRNFNEFMPAASIDANRFEQEIIYFLEKLDITEEKVRLKNHCTYFINTIEGEDSPGRKLGFIAQEMGREINTIGSKANDSDIQKMVVQMKDELEKIKEQLMNIL